MDMRQPEVSVGIRRLLNEDMISEKKIMKKSKGRPRYEYSLKAKAKVHSKLKAALNDSIKETTEQIAQLDKLFMKLK
jgi:predicted transcriptional regulator